MTDIGMAVNAPEHVTTRLQGQHLVDHFGVAMETRILGHTSISRFDLNRIVEVFKREGKGMEEPVVSLGCPFADEVVGQMTVVTNGDTLMTGFLPRVKMILHDVTVGARLRIVTQVTSPLPIAKCKCSQPEERTKHDAEHDSQQSNPSDNTWAWSLHSSTVTLGGCAMQMWFS